MKYSSIDYRESEGIAIITLNRPKRLNAWTPIMGTELVDAAEKAASEREIRAIILTGSGRGFCAGMDHDNLSEIDENSSRNRRIVLKPNIPKASQRQDYQGLFTFFPSIGKPVIAAINGPAAGSGLVLALSCDIRIASADAILTSSFAHRGLIAEHGIAWLLKHHAGAPTALDLLLSGRRVAVHEAKEMGLINRVCKAGESLSAAIEYAREMVQECSPRSLQVIKRQVWDAAFENLYEATEVANQEMLLSFDSSDFREALSARSESRKPRFEGI